MDDMDFSASLDLDAYSTYVNDAIDVLRAATGDPELNFARLPVPFVPNPVWAFLDGAPASVAAYAALEANGYRPAGVVQPTPWVRTLDA